MKGSAQYLCCLPILYNLAETHDGDIITHKFNDREVMGDEDVGKPKSLLEVD